MNRELRERWKKAKGEVLGVALYAEDFRWCVSSRIRQIHIKVRRYCIYDALNGLKECLTRGDEDSKEYYLKMATGLAKLNNSDTRYMSCGDDVLELSWQESEDQRDQFYGLHVKMDWTDRAFEVWSKLRKAVGEYRDAPLYQQGLGPRSTVKWLLGRRNVVPTKHLHLPDRGYGETVIDAEFDIDAKLPVFEKPQPEPVIEQPELAVVA